MKSSYAGEQGAAVTDAGRQAEHARKVEFLDTLAVLAGCEETIGGTLPDGSRPDVLRLDSRRWILFVGDAKHSESPECRETQARLLGYMRWLSAHVGIGGTGMFTVCFNRGSDTDAWVRTLGMLGHEAGLPDAEAHVERFEPGLTVAWYAFEPSVGVSRPDTGMASHR